MFNKYDYFNANRSIFNLLQIFNKYGSINVNICNSNLSKTFNKHYYSHTSKINKNHIVMQIYIFSSKYSNE